MMMCTDIIDGTKIVMEYWLVVWNILSHIFEIIRFRGVETTNQNSMGGYHHDAITHRYRDIDEIRSE